MEPKFKIGDKVMYVGDQTEAYMGEVGFVISREYCEGGYIGNEFVLHDPDGGHQLYTGWIYAVDFADPGKFALEHDLRKVDDGEEDPAFTAFKDKLLLVEEV